MTHIELDDQILNHDKFIMAGKAIGGDAIWLWLGLRAYCSQRLSDGFIPNAMLDEVRGPKDGKRRAACLKVLKEDRLVEDRDDGVFLHDYLEHSASRDQVETWKRKARERKASYRATSPRTSHSLSRGDEHGSPVEIPCGVTDTRARGEVGGGDLIGSDQGDPRGIPISDRFAKSFEFECPESIEFSERNQSRARLCGKPIATLYELYRAKQLKIKAKFCNLEGVQIDFDAWMLNYHENHKDDALKPRGSKLQDTVATRVEPKISRSIANAALEGISNARRI